MKLLARRVLLIVVALLLASATMASAECAWVLWSHLTVDYPTDRSAIQERQILSMQGGWEIVAGMSSQQTCYKRMRQQIEALFAKARGENGRGPKGTSSAPPKVDGDTVFVAIPNNSKITGVEGEGVIVYRHEHLCLPDTVDPRGPKPKQ